MSIISKKYKRITVYDLNKYYLLMKEAKKKGNLSEEFTIEHLRISIPNIKINASMLQKMRIYGFIDKVGKPKNLTIYSFSNKHMNHMRK